MIRYALNCDQGHVFESWFQNSAAYDKQAKRSLVTCPICGSAKVEKSIMAPRLARADAANPQPPAPPPAPPNPAPAPLQQTPTRPVSPKTPVAMVSAAERELRQKLKELRDHITKNASYVGQRFPEEARKIHYGETEERHIYGEATIKEARELIEEGVDVAPLPPDLSDAN